MKYDFKITTLLISMFLITQLIGLVVIDFYQSPDNPLPYGMEPPEELREQDQIGSILFAFVIAIIFFFLLTKLNAEKFIRLWFFIVTIIALGLTLNVIFLKLNLMLASFYALIFSIPMAFYKIYKRNIIVHNLTELLIYPGIAAVFVPILGFLGIIILLIAISIYDAWAVWHSKIMIKMAKYQINNVKIFGGFFIPYVNSKQRKIIKELKLKYKNESDKVKEKYFKKAKIKVNLAILGGGDVIFPIITAGVIYKIQGLYPALMITLFATLSLLGLFIMARKGKFYPAMPFLAGGMFIGMFLNWLIF